MSNIEENSMPESIDKRVSKLVIKAVEEIQMATGSSPANEDAAKKRLTQAMNQIIEDLQSGTSTRLAQDLPPVPSTGKPPPVEAIFFDSYITRLVNAGVSFETARNLAAALMQLQQSVKGRVH